MVRRPICDVCMGQSLGLDTIRIVQDFIDGECRGSRSLIYKRPHLATIRRVYIANMLYMLLPSVHLFYRALHSVCIVAHRTTSQSWPYIQLTRTSGLLWSVTSDRDTHHSIHIAKPLITFRFWSAVLTSSPLRTTALLAKGSRQSKRAPPSALFRAKSSFRISAGGGRDCDTTSPFPSARRFLMVEIKHRCCRHQRRDLNMDVRGVIGRSLERGFFSTRR